MIRIPSRLGAIAWIPALAFGALASRSPALATTAPDLARAGTHAVAPSPAPLAEVERPAVRCMNLRLGQRPSEARPARTRRCQGSGPQGFVAPAIVAVAPPAPPESPPQLEPPAACAQDPLDPCTRSPRPPPQA